MNFVMFFLIFALMLSLFFTLFLLVSWIYPLFLLIQYKSKKNKVVNFDGVYEIDLASDNLPNPALVNAMVSKDLEVNLNGIDATIFDLINKGLILVDINQRPNSSKKEINLVINTSKIMRMNDCEEKKYLLKKFKENEVIELSKLRVADSFIKKPFSNGSMTRVGKKLFKFRSLTLNIVNRGLIHFLDEDNLRKCYKFGYIVLILSVIDILIVSLINPSLLFLAVVGMVLNLIFAWYIQFDFIDSNFTKEGLQFKESWLEFKKNLNALYFSKNPPESLKIWNNYLIYGTALGMGEKVYNLMAKNISNIADCDDDLILFNLFKEGGKELLDQVTSSGYVAEGRHRHSISRSLRFFKMK